MHGKTSKIAHIKTGIFKGLKNNLELWRFHSFIIDKNNIKQRFYNLKNKR